MGGDCHPTPHREDITNHSLCAEKDWAAKKNHDSETPVLMSQILSQVPPTD
jgi:hypothetical protein